jgi:SAM-dependent methyltransferase
MGNEFKGRREHSAEYFGDTRDYWWNLDFLQLMAKRWKFDAVREVLDLGCGVGHWGQLLSSVLPESARCIGIDREPKWVEQATTRAEARGLSRFSYKRGEAQHLPFPDDTFDLVTCQTVLIHVPDPLLVLAEMRRVTKPGGLVVLAEPNNLAESMILNSITSQSSVDDIVETLRFQLVCERGKRALGEGDNSLGARVPGFLAALQFTDIEAYVNDKATTVFPPYSSSEQHAFGEDVRDRAARGYWNWSEPETRRFFVAGGGSEHDFAVHLARALDAQQDLVRSLDAGTYHAVLGGAFHLVAGRKGEAISNGPSPKNDPL